MFTGMTLTTLMADADTILVQFAVPITVLAAIWVSRGILRMVRSFFGG